MALLNSPKPKIDVGILCILRSADIQSRALPSMVVKHEVEGVLKHACCATETTAYIPSRTLLRTPSETLEKTFRLNEDSRY